MPEKKHPKLPPASPAPCAHEHLKFVNGTYMIACIDCDQRWAAVKDGVPDYTLQATPMYPPRDTRHDKWVLPRTEPITPGPGRTVMKKKEFCVCCAPDGKCIHSK